jgi:adenosylcobalamin-dependent ribonucleoside-triphosphate reductase
LTKPSVRAQVITRRTYNRPTETGYETWEQTVDRVIDHQNWLWNRAAGTELGIGPELKELRQLMLERKVMVSGRTLWLGGTDVAKKREASQFNCAHLKVETIHDVVDSLWLLLQGCGVGFTPVVGTLSGFTTPISDVEVIRSKRIKKGGHEGNKESTDSGTWTITIGDSAEAWAKSIGKLLSFKGKATKFVLDLTQLRPAGQRLAGYGWISSGDGPISKAFSAIIRILNKKSGQLLSKMDILDIMNQLGTVLSSRRSAEIALVYHDTPEWEEFARAKDDLAKMPHRSQSNNSVVFWRKPSDSELDMVFQIIKESGGSEPGIINGEEARRRAPWFSGVNPCAEILLGNKSFCNLSEVDLLKFRDDSGGLDRALFLAGRANYRQTLVNLDDGILQRTWHENNEYLRLCGVGLTGIATRSDLNSYDYKRFKNLAIHGAYSMADELGTQRPKNVTTIKPSGTLSKIMDTTEGCHKPMGKYIFNNVNFSINDPMLPKLREAGYHVVLNPTDEHNAIVTFPVAWDNIRFDKEGDLYVNKECATEQLTRYKLLMDSYVEQNCSITVSYKEDEIPAIRDWLKDNWSSYVGVSFLPITNTTYEYLPQEVVTEARYKEYVAQLTEVDFSDTDSTHEIEGDECATGVCPTK